MPRVPALTRLVLLVGATATLALGCSGDSPSDEGAPAPAAAASDLGPTTPDGLTVKVADGTVQGDAVGGSRQFLKIPYAKPPTGERRWRAPEPPEPWTGVRHEADFAEACPQNANSQGPASMNEDCLYANVWAPAPDREGAPVMVWIHGGGNFAGSARDFLPTTTDVRWYDGQHFATEQGVVLVSFNYRLGPMGFFAHPGLAGEGSPLGNQGLLDQRRLLEWVRDNVTAFGGDPDNVTIFGESAGSADVCYHVASPGSRGLFHRAVSQSGGCTARGGLDRTAADAAPGMEEFARSMGCEVPAEALTCLRAKPAEEIMTAARQPEPTAGTTLGALNVSFGVVVEDGPDGVLPAAPRELFARGEVAKVPYILGSNTDEGTLFAVNAPVTDEASYRSALGTRFGENADAVAQRYPLANHGGDAKAALAAVIGDSGLICGTHETARTAARAGLPVYMYNFDIPWAIAPTLKAAHAAEISHVFGNPYKPDANSTAVGEAMNTYWATFAAKGDPNYDGAPARWPSFPSEGDSDQRIQFGTDGVTVVTDFRREECAFWRSLNND